MVNLDNFLNQMVVKLGLSRSDILDNNNYINIFNEVNAYIDKIISNNKTIEKDITNIFNGLLESDEEINSMLKKFKLVSPDKVNEFKITLAKIQLKILVTKYNKYLIDNKFIKAVNDKIEALLKLMESNLTSNKYYAFYKYLKYKNKYLQLKYNYI